MSTHQPSPKQTNQSPTKHSQNHYPNNPLPKSQQIFACIPLSSFSPAPPIPSSIPPHKKHQLQEPKPKNDHQRKPTDIMWHSETLQSSESSPNALSSEELKLFNKIKSITYLNTSNTTCIPQLTPSHVPPSIQQKLVNLNDPSIINAQSRDELQIENEQPYQFPSMAKNESELQQVVCSIDGKLEDEEDEDCFSKQKIIGEGSNNNQYHNDGEMHREFNKSKYAVDYSKTFSSTPTNHYSSIAINNENSNISIRHPNNLLILDPTTNHQKFMSCLQPSKANLPRPATYFHSATLSDHQTINPAQTNTSYKQPTHKQIERNPMVNSPMITVPSIVNNNVRVNNCQHVTSYQPYDPSQVPQKQYSFMTPQQNKKLTNIPQQINRDQNNSPIFNENSARKSRDIQVFNYSNRTSYDHYIPAMPNPASTQISITSLTNKLPKNTNIDINYQYISNPSDNKQSNSTNNRETISQKGKDFPILGIGQLLNATNSTSNHKKNHSADNEQSKGKKKLIVTISTTHNTTHHSSSHIAKGTTEQYNSNNQNIKNHPIIDTPINKIVQTSKTKNQQDSKNNKHGNRIGRNAKNMQWKVMMKGNCKIDEPNQDSDNKCPEWLCCQFIEQKKTFQRVEIYPQQPSSKSKHLSIYSQLKESVDNDNLSTTRCNLLDGNQMIGFDSQNISKNKSQSLEFMNRRNMYQCSS